MSDDKIKAMFQKYGRTADGWDLAMVNAVADAIASQRTFVGLTDEERNDIVLNSTSKNKAVAKTETKLKQKNGYVEEKNI